MISEIETAKRISEAMWEILRQIQESMAAVQETCSPEDYAAYHKAVGRVVGPIMFEVLEPLYKHHPDLKPPGWD